MKDPLKGEIVTKYKKPKHKGCNKLFTLSNDTSRRKYDIQICYNLLFGMGLCLDIQQITFAI